MGLRLPALGAPNERKSGLESNCRSYRMSARPLPPTAVIRKVAAARRSAGATAGAALPKRKPFSWKGFSNLPKEAQPNRPAPDLREQTPPVQGKTKPPQQRPAPNGASPQPMDTENVPENAQPAAAPPAAKRPGRAARKLRHLPEGFEEGTAPIGKPVLNATGKSKGRPVVPVIFPKGESRIGDSLDALPNGETPARPNKTLTVAEHLYAKEFSDDHGFTIQGVAPRPRPARTHAHRPAPEPPHRP